MDVTPKEPYLSIFTRRELVHHDIVMKTLKSFKFLPVRLDVVTRNGGIAPCTQEKIKFEDGVTYHVLNVGKCITTESIMRNDEAANLKHLPTGMVIDVRRLPNHSWWVRGVFGHFSYVSDTRIA